MKNNLFRIFVFIILIAAAAFLAGGCSSEETPAPDFSLPDKISVVLDDNYPPYIFKSEDGTLQGILVDQWALFEKKTGIKVDLTAMDWGQALQRMQSGEFDVIDTIFRTPEREKIYDFTQPYATIDVPIYFSNKISGIRDAESLKGFRVAVKAGDAAVDYLLEHGITDLRYYPSYEAIFRAAKDQQEIVLVVDKPAARYYLYKFNLQDQFNESSPLYSGQFHRAVIKGNRDLLLILEWGFSKISRQEYREIDDKWFDVPANGNLAQNLRYLTIAVGIAVLAGAGLALWNRILQRQVHRRTVELEDLVNRLSESEGKFRQLAEHIREVFWIRDIASGQVLYISPHCEALIGVSQEEIYRSAEAYLSNIYFLDRDRVRAASRRQREGIPMDEEYRVMTGTGLRWIHSRSFPVTDESGLIYRMVGIAEDITEQKNNEAEIIRQKNMFAELFNNLPLGTVLLDYNSRILEINPAFTAIFGYEIDEIRNQNIDQVLVPTELMDEGLRSSKRIIQGKIVSFESVRLRKDGSKVAVRIMGVPIRVNGKLVGIHGLYEDIEERKLSEQALVESEERFFKIFDTNPLPICIARLNDSVIIEVNQAFCRLLGYTRDQVLGKTTPEIGLFLDASQRKEIVRSLVRQGGMREVEIQYRNSAGEVRESLRYLELLKIRDQEYVLGLMVDITEQKAARQEIEKTHLELAQAYEATLEGWGRALELRERETAGHSKRVIDLTIQLATAMGIPESEHEHIRRGALLHDIGKMAVPDAILSKPGPLSEEEWEIMRRHTTYAYDLLKDIEYLKPALDIPRSHHERWDGLGYPDGLAGENIPLAARIFSLVDVWDALRSDRPYRKAWSAKKARGYIREQAGKQFDPAIVEKFLEILNNEEPSWMEA